MYQFEFNFIFQDYPYTAECRAIPIDGSTELHVTPQDGELFESFGMRLLSLLSDGSITAQIPVKAEERDYVMAIADGLATYFDSQGQKTN